MSLFNSNLSDRLMDANKRVNAENKKKNDIQQDQDEDEMGYAYDERFNYGFLNDNKGVFVNRDDDNALNTAKGSNMTVLFGIEFNFEGDAEAVEIQDFIKANGIDAAITNFTGAEKDSKLFALIKKYPNLIVARTFSKAYALAGARVGYMIAHRDVTRMIEKTFMPYHMNVLSLATADIVYQMRDEFVPRIQMMIAERKRMTERLRSIGGLKVYPSATNFILIKHERATELNARLEELDIGVRYFVGNGRLENCLRISIGTREENDEWFAAIEKFL